MKYLFRRICKRLFISIPAACIIFCIAPNSFAEWVPNVIITNVAADVSGNILLYTQANITNSCSAQNTFIISKSTMAISPEIFQNLYAALVFSKKYQSPTSLHLEPAYGCMYGAYRVVSAIGLD